MKVCLSSVEHLPGEHFRIDAEESADVLAYLVERLLVDVVVEGVPELQQAGEGRDEVAVCRALDADFLEGGPEIVGSRTVIGGREVRRGAVTCQTWPGERSSTPT